MGSFSGMHWLVVIIYFGLIIPPFWMLFGRFGMPKWLSIFAIIPVVSLIYIWILAYRAKNA